MSRYSLPESGQAPEDILETLRARQQGGPDWQGGRLFSLVYHYDEAHLALQREAFGLFLAENTVNPFLFPGLRQMEQELVDIGLELSSAPAGAAGLLTSGGTESIFLSLLAWRDRAWREPGGRRRRELLAAANLHPAFDKAAHYLGLELRRVPVAADHRADPAAMRRAISRRTLLIAASAPSYPHGLIDPIPEIAALAAEAGLPLHVDACLGGFLLPWAEQLGIPLPAWDFRLPGVASLSADLHKFGFAAKGASLLLNRDAGMIDHQVFVRSDYPGGIYASALFQGSRSGGALAAAWASLHHLGRRGYLDTARRLIEGGRQLRAALAAIPQIAWVGDPQLNIQAYATPRGPDIFAVAERLAQRGWLPDRQQFPPSIHVALMPHHLPHLEAYAADVAEAVAWAEAHPEASGSGEAALYGLSARLPWRGPVERQVRARIGGAYAAAPQAAQTPGWIGWINRALLRWGR